LNKTNTAALAVLTVSLKKGIVYNTDYGKGSEKMDGNPRSPLSGFKPQRAGIYRFDGVVKRAVVHDALLHMV